MAEVRALTEGDFQAAIELDAAAFAYEAGAPDIQALALPLLRAGRIIGGFEDTELVSVGAILDKDLTFPGGRSSPAAAVTWVAVRPGEQRRGLLRDLMRHQQHGLHAEKREAVAILTASESAIYGRFGYGMAVAKAEAALPAGLAFRPAVAVDRVREIGRDAALPLLKAAYEQVRRTRAGYLTRDEMVWHQLYDDLPIQRGGAGELRFAVHPDGVLAFRVTVAWTPRGPSHTVTVFELVATTPRAAASLWRHVLDRAMVREVKHLRYGPDETLQDLLVDVRALQNVPRDHLWLRIVDLDRAVPLRSYQCAAQLVVEITDDFCPWNAGSWRLDLDTAGGTATRTTEPPQLTIDIADLAAAFLGGTRIARLAAAGLITGDDEAVAHLDAALATARGPYCPETF